MNRKRINLPSVAASLAIAAAFIIPHLALAQSVPQATAAPTPPTGFKLILNNESVRVFESTFAPGVVVPMTNYPKRTIYVLKGTSQFNYLYADGRTDTLNQEVGAVSSRGAERMSVTNAGAIEVVVLVVIDKRDIPTPQ